MGELGWNKIFGAILAAVLIIFGLREVSAFVFPTGGHGHHGEEKEETINERMAREYAYYVPVTETAAGGVEEVYDLGALLASASVDRGAATVSAKCATCHNWNPGDPVKTGPNLYGTVGTGIGEHSPGFAYSSWFRSNDESWTYENLDGFLANPAAYAPGTAMSFIGLRRDQERADVIAFLASITPDAPAFPEPLPEETAEGEEGLPAEGETTEGDVVEGEANEGGEPLEVEPTEEDIDNTEAPAPSEEQPTEEEPAQE